MLLAAVLALLALVIGVGLGAALTPRILERKRRRAVEQSGITVSQMLEHVVSGSPVGIVVVDTYRDVVYTNDRARELGLVKDRLLNDGRGWPPSARWPPARTARSTCPRASARTLDGRACRCAATCGC